MKVRCAYAEECEDETCHHFDEHEWDRIAGCTNVTCKRVQADDAQCVSVEEDHGKDQEDRG